MRCALRWRSVVVLVATVACAPNDPTQLVVVVDSDLPASALDGVEVSVLGLRGGEQRARALLSDGALPRYVVLERRGGTLGPIDVEARALLGGAPTGVARKARTSFVHGRTLRLDLFLAAACVSHTCDATQTCDRGTCVAPDVAPDQLTVWTGLESDGGSDASMPDDGDASVPDDGGGIDANVPSDSGVVDARVLDDGGLTDGGIDAPDVDAGGCACLSPLPPDTIGASCLAGRCVYECEPGYGDCDGRIDEDNGCEQQLDTREHCGACDERCPEPTEHEEARDCTDRGCVVECAELRGDCNADPFDGCETDLTRNGNCGRCGRTCQGPGNMCRSDGTCRR